MINAWKKTLALVITFLIPISLMAVRGYGYNSRNNGHYQENGDWVDTERGEQPWDVEEPYSQD